MQRSGTVTAFAADGDVDILDRGIGSITAEPLGDPDRIGFRPLLDADIESVNVARSTPRIPRLIDELLRTTFHDLNSIVSAVIDHPLVQIDEDDVPRIVIGLTIVRKYVLERRRIVVVVDGEEET